MQSRGKIANKTSVPGSFTKRERETDRVSVSICECERGGEEEGECEGECDCECQGECDGKCEGKCKDECEGESEGESERVRGV